MATQRTRWGLVALLAALLVAVGMAVPPVWAQEEAPPEELMAEGDTTALADTTALGMAGDSTAMGATEEEPPAMEEEEGGFLARLRESGLVELAIAGGWFMVGLGILSIIGLAFIIERFVTLQRAHTNVRRLMRSVLEALTREGVDAATQICERTRGPVATILHAGLTRAHRGMTAVEKAIESAGTIEMSFLERGLIVLSTVANVAPLLGFLGTVSGMIHAFNAIAAAEQVNAKLVATGISEALITTATGLIIAIPVQAFHNYFVSRVDRFVVEMEESTAELVDAMIEMESGTGAMG